MSDLKDRDIVNGVSYQMVKLVHGDTGVANTASQSNPIPMTGSVTLSGSSTVNVGNTPSVTISGTPNVAITGSVAVTGAYQTTQPVSGTFWQSTQPVSGTFWQSTQPVSAASLPLPSGAATDATLSALSTKVYGRTSVFSQTTTLTSSTSETTIVTAGGSNNFCDISCLVISNSSLIGGTSATIKDATGGTTRAVYFVPTGSSLVVPFPGRWSQTTANNNWTITLSTSLAANVTVNVTYVKTT